MVLNLCSTEREIRLFKRDLVKYAKSPYVRRRHVLEDAHHLFRVNILVALNIMRDNLLTLYYNISVVVSSSLHSLHFFKRFKKLFAEHQHQIVRASNNSCAYSKFDTNAHPFFSKSLRPSWKDVCCTSRGIKFNMSQWAAQIARWFLNSIWIIHI